MASTRTKKAKLIRKSSSSLSKNQSETISKPSQPSDATALPQKKDQTLESAKPRKSSGKDEVEAPPSADLQTPKKLPARATRGLRGEARKEALRSTSKKPLQTVQPSSKKNRVDPVVRKPTKSKVKATGKAKQPNKPQASPSLANEFESGVDNSEMPIDMSNTSKVPIYMQQKIEAEFDLADVEDIYELPKSSTTNEKVKKKRVRKKPLEIASKKTTKSITSKKLKLSSKPSNHHKGQSSDLHVSRHYSDSEVEFDVFEQNFDHFDDNENPVEENVVQMDPDDEHYLQDEFTSERQPLEEKDEQPRQYYKTPSIPKRVGSKAMKEGKVSTPRVNEKPPEPAKVPIIQANTKSPSLNDLKDRFFGFDDEQDEDGDESQASSIGGLTLSEISPVKRSSLLPSNHCFSLVGCSSYLGLSQLSFTKPLSSRPQRFAINTSRATLDRTQGSSFTFTAVKPKPIETTCEDLHLIPKAPTSPKKSNKENLSIQVPTHRPVVFTYQPQSSTKAAVQDFETKDSPRQPNPVASVTCRKRKNQLSADISEDHNLAPTVANEGIFQKDRKEEIFASDETSKESKRQIPKRSKREPKNSAKKTISNLTSTFPDEVTSQKKEEDDQEEEIFVRNEIQTKSSKEIPKKSKGKTKKASTTKSSKKDAKCGKMTKKNEDDENDSKSRSNDDRKQNENDENETNAKSKAGQKKKEKQTLIYEVISNQKQVKTWKRAGNNSESKSRSLEETDPDLVGPFDSIITSNDEDRCEDAKSGIFEDDDDDEAPKTSFQKLNKTYQRKSFIQDNLKPQQKKAEAKLQDWESKQSFHFGEIEEFDLIFK